MIHEMCTAIYAQQKLHITIKMKEMKEMQKIRKYREGSWKEEIV